MILPVLLLVLLLLPVLVLQDFSAGGLYCTHTAVSGGVSTWGVTLFLNTTSLNLFLGLIKILLHLNPPDYLCKPLVIYFVSSPGLWLCVPPCRQWLWETRSHLCQVHDPGPSPPCTTSGTPLSRTSWKRLCSLKHFWNYKTGTSKGHPWVGHRGRQPHSLKLSGNYEAKTSQGHASHWAEASSSEKFRGPCIPFSWHAIFQEKLFLL